MLRFVVTKNGKFVGKPFYSREEAVQVAEMEKMVDPTADVRVHPVLTAGEELVPDEGQALVDAILEVADFSDLPPEHLGSIGSSDEEQGETAPNAAPGHNDPGKEKKPPKHGKKGKAAPAKGFSFFVRHPSYVPVSDEVLEELWAQNRVAIYLPGVGDGGGPKPAVPPKSSDKMAAKHLANLAKGGGYAWVETRVRPGVAKIGRVSPQRSRDVRASWSAPKHPQHVDEAGEEKEVVLRTMQLEDVKEIALDEMPILRAERPLLGGAMLPWTGCGSRLKALVEGVSLERTWGNLMPLQQRAVCAEFLRLHRKPDYPKLKFLLTPEGIAFKKVDLYGMEEDGTLVYAQVTPRRKGTVEAKWKVKKLKEFDRPGNKLVCFCRISDPDKGDTPSLFPPGPAQEDGVLFIPVEEVLRWVKKQLAYAEKLFSV